MTVFSFSFSILVGVSMGIQLSLTHFQYMSMVKIAQKFTKLHNNLFILENLGTTHCPLYKKGIITLLLKEKEKTVVSRSLVVLEEK